MTIPTYTPTIQFAAGSHTMLAAQLNAAMERNWGARHLYLVTYGTPWVPLPTPGVIPSPVMTMSTPTVAGIPVVTDAEAQAAIQPAARSYSNTAVTFVR
jgi:hypothetical protein